MSKKVSIYLPRLKRARTRPDFSLEAVAEAASTMFGWTVAMFLSTLVGFCLGYWIGHRQIVGMQETLSALTWVPLLWLGFWQVFIAYGSLATAWYLPVHFDLRWMRLVAFVVNLAVWLLVIYSIVIETDHSKGLHF